MRLLYALEDEEIFPCEVPNNEQKWYRAEDMSNELWQKHISNIKSVITLIVVIQIP